MWFLLRAALVIGAVSVLALEKRGTVTLPARLALPDGINPDALRSGVDLPGLIVGLPPETRARFVRAGTEEIARRVGGALAQDRLPAGDRRPASRGAQER